MICTQVLLESDCSIICFLIIARYPYSFYRDGWISHPQTTILGSFTIGYQTESGCDKPKVPSRLQFLPKGNFVGPRKSMSRIRTVTGHVLYTVAATFVVIKTSLPSSSLLRKTREAARSILTLPLITAFHFNKETLRLRKRDFKR